MKTNETSVNKVVDRIINTKFEAKILTREEEDEVLEGYNNGKYKVEHDGLGLFGEKNKTENICIKILKIILVFTLRTIGFIIGGLLLAALALVRIIVNVIIGVSDMICSVIGGLGIIATTIQAITMLNNGTLMEKANIELVIFMYIFSACMIAFPKVSLLIIVGIDFASELIKCLIIPRYTSE